MDDAHTVTWLCFGVAGLAFIVCYLALRVEEVAKEVTRLRTAQFDGEDAPNG